MKKVLNFTNKHPDYFFKTNQIHKFGQQKVKLDHRFDRWSEHIWEATYRRFSYMDVSLCVCLLSQNQ